MPRPASCASDSTASSCCSGERDRRTRCPRTAARAAASSRSATPARASGVGMPCVPPPRWRPRGADAARLRCRPGLAQQQPNVVVIMTDDQTAASVPTMPQRERPARRARARTSSRRSRASRCAARRARPTSPGSTPTTTACSTTAGSFGGFRMLDNTNTLPVWLQAAGYRTMHVGRYLNGYEYRDGIPAGYTRLVREPAFERVQLRELEGQRERRAALLSAARPPGRLPDRPVRRDAPSG